VCSRDYDPGPPPADEKLYEGSALMALWEDHPVERLDGPSDEYAWQLAGWNVKRRRKP
jgi:hypothetical protein